MIIRNSLYGSALLATLLFSGCNMIDEGTTSTDTTTNTETTTAAKTASEISSDKKALAQTVKNVKVAIAKIENPKATQSADNVKVHVADIVHSLLNFKKEKTFKSNGAKNSFMEAIANGDIVLTVEEQAELDAMSIEAFNAKYFEAFAESVTGKVGKQTQGLLTPLTDKLKDLIVDASSSDLLDGTVNAVFKAALNSEGVTTAMLDMALGSETITQIMIDALIYDWGLTTKMIPMLETNKEFGEKFAELAKKYEIMGRYFFTAVDAPMYGALTKAMLLSPETTTLIMSELMITYGEDYFVIPATDYTPVGAGQPGDNERFVSLLLDTGKISKTTGDAADSTTRGDGNELANEEFFYALFSSPASTANFVEAMQKVKAKDANTVKTLMDHIFLGQRTTEDGEIVDTEQSIYNIYAIAKAMGKGIGTEGFDTYKKSFVGFAGLVSFDRYLPYGKSFLGAGSHYMDANGYNVSEFITLVREAIWPAEIKAANAEAAEKSVQSKRLHADGDTTETTATEVETAWYDELWDSVTTFFGDGYDSMAAWWDAQTVDFDAYISEITDGISTAVGEAVDGLTAEAHTYIQGEIATLLNDPDYVLPPFSELNIDYVTGEAERRFDDYITVNGYDGLLSDISDSDFVQEYVYGTLLETLEGTEYWEYMPNWIAGMDWLKLPESYADYKLEFNADNIAVYIISKNDSLEDMRTILGLDDLIQVDTLEDSPISNENDEFYIYKLVLLNGEDIDFAALEEAGVEAGDYVSSIVVDNSEATSEPATETTTTETAAN
jgi:hypothetical protein